MSLKAAVENLIKREKTTPDRTKKESKSSSEILSELFGAFNATPPEIRESPEKKSKRVKKEKKHKKDKKRSRRDSSSSDSSDRRHRRRKKKSRRRRSSSSSLSPPSPARHRSRSRERKTKHEVTSKAKVKHDVKDVKPKVEIKCEPVKTEQKSEPKVKIENDVKVEREGTPPRKIRRVSIKEEENHFQTVVNNEDASMIPLPDEMPRLSSNDLRLTLDSKHTEAENDKLKNSGKGSKGIQIKNLKFSTVFEETVKKAEEEARKKKEACEEGEYTDSSSSRAPSVDNSSQFPKTSDPGGLKKTSETKCDEKSDRSSSRQRRSSDRSKRSSRKSRDRSRSKKKSRSRSRHRSRSQHKSRSRHRSKSRHRSRSRDKKRSSRRSRSKSYTRSFSRRHNNLKLGPKKSRSPGVRLADTEKKRLLEVARRNAINMLKNGAIPAAAAALPPHTRQQVMTAIQSGGKSVDELTDFCKHLSKKEALGELSSVSSNDSGSENEDVMAFHHPFLVKEKAPIVMNIRGGAPLPVKSGPLAIQNKDELRMQFPVSSGTQHRGSEKEWRAVTPPPTTDNQIARLNSRPTARTVPAPSAASAPTAPLALPAPPAPPELPPSLRTFVGGTPLTSMSTLAVPGPQAYPPGVEPSKHPSLDITSMLSQKLLALRQQTERDTIPAASGLGHHGVSKLGAFTGSKGANFLTPRELASGSQAWAKKDQLVRAAPVAGGMGMHLLQKMGWTPGKGLGKEESGTLQPLLLEVKLDTKGLQAREEQKKPSRGGNRRMHQGHHMSNNVSGVNGKHPVSLLGEYCSKRKLGPPEYEVCFECGPDHKKNFLFKVKVAGVEYQPSVASANKKQAKADSAQVALQKLGVLPS